MNAQHPTAEVLEIAQQSFSGEWEIYSTQSGGWQLRLMSHGGALVNFLMNPCAANLGEQGKPYQVNCKAIRNYASLTEALEAIATANK